ncbi:hypothetical protein [uncultured Jannaschia sp.]|uniref:hypothetical protein n=1 Tax=uncultured Jannaschia sp. TaxID=293347 RepID=UPI00261AD30B|nr:hypothetical protein [uncultured Jannaschia sp.]
MPEAAEIYQRLADATSRAAWDRDFDALGQLTDYPYTFTSDRGTRVTHTFEEFRADVEAFRQSLATLGATAYHRVCLKAEYVEGSPDRIDGTHRSYVLRGGSYLVDPYECAMELVRRNGLWLTRRISLITFDERVQDFMPQRYFGRFDALEAGKPAQGHGKGDER